MRTISYLRVEFFRLLRSRTTWLALLAASVCPLAGYFFFQPAGTGTTAAIVLANPLLTGALGGTFVFAALTLFELNRVRKGRMEPITDSIVPPMTISIVKSVSLLLAALVSFALTFVLYLPYTWARLGETFHIGEYCKFSLIFLMPALVFGVLLASAFYQLFRRADLSFVCVAALMLVGLGPWNRDTYLLYWINLETLGFSGDLGNTSIYRMALYSRCLWLCLFSGVWAFSMLCIRNHGKGLLGSFAKNLKKAYLPALSAVLIASASFLFINQPYMDHGKPQTLDENILQSGGGFSISAGKEDRENNNIIIHNAQYDLSIEERKGTVTGRAIYELENISGAPQECVLLAEPGYIIERITVNGTDISFTDLKNDYFPGVKDISLVLPNERELKVIVSYKGINTVSANTGALTLNNEITPEYLSLRGNGFAPVFEAVRAEDCTFSGNVTLPKKMNLVSNGRLPKVVHENTDGTRTWHVEGNGIRPTIFAGNYVSLEIKNAGFPVNFWFSANHRKEFETLDIQNLLNDTLSYCARQYGNLPYSDEYPLNIVMTTSHATFGGAVDNLSFMGEDCFTQESLNNSDKGANGAEVIAHELIHQWWGGGRMVFDPQNPDWSAEALTCYANYRMMKAQRGEEYARRFYADVWQRKYASMMDNFYLRNPEYLAMLPEKHQTALNNLIFDASVYGKGPLQVLKAEQLVGSEEKMDEILRGLFQNGGTEMPPLVTWHDFLDACGLTEEQLMPEGGADHE